MSTGEHRTGRRRLALVAGGIAAAISAALLLFNCSGDESLREAFVFEEGGDAFVTAVVGASYRGSRGSRGSQQIHLRSFNLRTGALLGERSVTDKRHGASYKLARRVGHQVWSHSERDGIQLVDLRTTSPLLTESTLTARLPELAGGFKVQHPTYNDYSAPTRGLPVTLHDGRNAWIGMEGGLHFAPVPTDPWRPGYFCGPDGGARPSCARKECIAFQQVAGTSAMQLGTQPVWGSQKTIERNPVNETAPDVATAEPFLKPALVRLLETECAIELDGDVLVLHDSAAFDPKEALLTRADRRGRRVWTQPVSTFQRPGDELEPYRAAVVGGELVILMSEPGRASKQSLTVALVDPKTGAARARHVLISR